LENVAERAQTIWEWSGRSSNFLEGLFTNFTDGIGREGRSRSPTCSKISGANPVPARSQLDHLVHRPFTSFTTSSISSQIRV